MFYFRNLCQRGSATALAFGIMLVLGIMMAFSSTSDNVLSLSVNQQMAAQAAYAAEVGMRTSTLILNNSIRSLAGSPANIQYAVPAGLYDPILAELPHFSAGVTQADGITLNNNVFYTVTVFPSVWPPPVGPANLLYTFTVTGQGENGTARTLIGRYQVNIPAPVGPNSPNIPGPTMVVHNGGAHNNNDTLIVNPSYILDKDGNAIPIYSTAKSNKITNNTIWGPNPIIVEEKDANLPPFLVSLDWKDYQYDQTSLPSALNTSADLSGNYYLSHSFVQNTGTISAKDSNDVRIYAKQDITINDSLLTDKNTNLILIAGKNVTINTPQNRVIKGNIQIYAGGTVTINHTMQGSVLVMSGKDIIINTGHLRYAYLISYGSMTVNGNNSKTNPVTLIEGAIMAGERLTLNGPTIIFRPDMISNWGEWPPDVTYP